MEIVKVTLPLPILDHEFSSITMRSSLNPYQSRCDEAYL